MQKNELPVTIRSEANQPLINKTVWFSEGTSATIAKEKITGDFFNFTTDFDKALKYHHYFELKDVILGNFSIQNETGFKILDLIVGH